MNIRQSLESVDKFYLVFGITLTLLSVMLVITFQTIFSSYINAYDVNPSDIENELKVNTAALNEAYSWALKK